MKIIERKNLRDRNKNETRTGYNLNYTLYLTGKFIVMIGMSNYKIINDEELENFRNICSDEGYQPNEFNFHEHSIQIPDSHGSINGKVTILRKGKSKTYKTGDGSRWYADFENDLRNKFFD